MSTSLKPMWITTDRMSRVRIEKKRNIQHSTCGKFATYNNKLMLMINSSLNKQINQTGRRLILTFKDMLTKASASDQESLCTIAWQISHDQSTINMQYLPTFPVHFTTLSLFFLPSIYPRVHEIFSIMTYRLVMLKENGHRANITRHLMVEEHIITM